MEVCFVVEEERKEQPQNMMFALDIGTRSIIGMVGQVEGDRVRILAVEKQEHRKRAMIDGQIEDIVQVGKVAAEVTTRLEARLGCRLNRVSIAAAGRALHTEVGHFELNLPDMRRVSDETIGQLEAGAVSEAERALSNPDQRLGRFYLVGYTVSRYILDSYPISTLQGHKGQKLEADVVATFLPSEVVESLYSAMQEAGLEVASLTLEPIAAINAAIPKELRLLNLVMADIGAGTSDIAACRDGSVVGYTMATVAGDEITETIMRAYLVDFETAERLKAEFSKQDQLSFTDILGLEQEITSAELEAVIQPAVRQLAEELARRIREINGGSPSAVFLAGGGSKLNGLRDAVAAALDMDNRRVAIAGGNFKTSAFSDAENLNDPEYATPLGIVVSAGLGMISDSFRVRLNGQQAKLFRSGVLTALDVLLMNGYNYGDLIGRTGQSLAVTIDGQRTLYRGELATPSVLLINGKEMPPSTVIQAGDSIEFTPARAGQPGKRTLQEALGSAEAAGSALVNGMPAKAAYELRSGDSIETNALVLLRSKKAPAKNGGVKNPDAKTDVSENHSQGQSPAPKTENGKKLKHPKQAEPDGEPAEEITQKPAAHKFILNDRPLELPQKEDGAPYYLMDLLDRTGLDFEHLDRPVILRVNGEDSAFTRVLLEGDAVTIRVKDEEAL